MSFQPDVTRPGDFVEGRDSTWAPFSGHVVDAGLGVGGVWIDVHEVGDGGITIRRRHAPMDAWHRVDFPDGEHAVFAPDPLAPGDGLRVLQRGLRDTATAEYAADRWRDWGYPDIEIYELCRHHDTPRSNCQE